MLIRHFRIAFWPIEKKYRLWSPNALSNDFNFACLGEVWAEDSIMITFVAALFFANTGVNLRWELNDQLDLANDIEGCNRTAEFSSYSIRKI